MKRQFIDKNGMFERELTQIEINKYANDGDVDCKKEIAKQDLINAVTDTQKIDIILKFIGLK